MHTSPAATTTSPTPTPSSLAPSPWRPRARARCCRARSSISRFTGSTRPRRWCGRQEGAAILTANTKLAIDAALADLAFERGDYPTAKKLIDRLAREDRSSTNSFRLANYEWHLGDMARADRLLAEAESLYAGPSDQYRAWFRAQRGDLALDRGRYDEALARYREAEELFSGWWANYARTARVFAQKGQREQAIFSYQDLISRTNSPEMMDALAELYAATDDSIPQKRWTEKARKLHLAREARFPEAAVGHELQHYLRLGADPREAVRLAERNRDLRPNGDAWTWLAQAYLRAGDATRAGTAIDRALTLGWKTPEALATASLIRAAEGKKAEALRLETEARAKNPDAMGLVSWLAPEH
ncbi:MAG: tetratricopeptide repeat protein [Candidatus Eisenbacteria bacterium]